MTAQKLLAFAAMTACCLILPAAQELKKPDTKKVEEKKGRPTESMEAVADAAKSRAIRTIPLRFTDADSTANTITQVFQPVQVARSDGAMVYVDLHPIRVTAAP